jgi:hypothetical protein
MVNTFRRLLLWVRFKWFLLRYTRDPDWKIKPETLVTLISMLDHRLLDDYTPNGGSKIPISVGFKNAQEAVILAERLVNLMNANGTVKDDIAGLRYNNDKWGATSLDRFLVTSKNTSIQPLVLYHILQDTLPRLKDAYDSKKQSPQDYAYYQRKTTWIREDLYIVLEALLSTALRP